MNPIIRSIGILVITWLLQVVLFRFGVFYGGWMVICFNIYGLILLPVDLHKTMYLIIGAMMGLFMDIVLLTDPYFQIGYITRELWTEAVERKPESQRSSSCIIRP